MQASEYIANFLAANGARKIFMLSGTGSIYLDDAIANHPDLAHFCARHEAAAVTMAAGTTKLTGELGVAVVTTGPGGINAFGGVAEAWVDSVPVMVISGQVEGSHYHPHLRSFGIQGFNIVDKIQQMTKYAVVVSDPLMIRYELEKALWHSTHGRAGPVWLDIQLNVQSAEFDEKDLRKFYPPLLDLATAPPIESNVREILNLLKHSQRPLFILGQGVRCCNRTHLFNQLATTLGVPVVATRLAIDLLPYETDWYFGLGGIRGRPANAIIARNADLIVSFGSSLAPALINQEGDAFAPDAKVVMIDTNEKELTKPGVRLHLTVRQDVGRVIEHLLDDELLRLIPSVEGWLNFCKKISRSNPIVRTSDVSNPINSYYFIERLDKQSSEGDVFVSDAGSAYYITGQALCFNNGQRDITSGAFATMGMALPLAIGAAASLPEARVFAITGDGSIELNIQELRTISENKLNIKIFVINNGGYASIRDSQDDYCGGRYTESTQVLNFSKVAAAFELPFRLIELVSELDSVIEKVLSRTGPMLVEVVCDRHQEMVLPKVSIVETEKEREFSVAE